MNPALIAIIVKVGAETATQLIELWKADGEPSLDDIRKLKDNKPSSEFFED